MNSRKPRYYKHPSGLPTLLHLSQVCIKRHLSQLQDVGTTPYHLLASILSLMSAKQLDQIETLSTQLTPHSDELWKQLIVKDFSDRPAELGPLELTKLKFEKMPYKSLYYKYSMNKEKDKNKIVTVDEIKRDPSVRCRSPFQNAYRRQRSPYAKNTILGKAMRESQNRSIIFGSPAMRQYDPYNAFKTKDCAPCIRAPRLGTAIRRTTFFDRHHSKQQPPTTTKPSTSKIMPIKGKQSSPCSSPPSSSGEVSDTLRKKRPHQPPSIFLQNKRPLPPSRASPTRKSEKKVQEKRKEATKEESSKIKPIKSSIFS
ncbi:RNA polymerase II transcription factor SIII (Elongin) subunit A family protein [Candida parapsilosis]|uniref:RNA polymerase II transcription factor SIII (Elongin) subunit A family protein n=1 Tax=Candida parapsilosis TaxID=5480 RepID=A0A8X7NPZ5_CANPA|nr:RNA polymerase II transcription factor SIII (Elongin) subunit A family protein [Candida parapsilosis]KAF6057215.1 RNA polymerase II transcription factor SIII (Elongin) subunit A family protein [Candida parapsilosis]